MKGQVAIIVLLVSAVMLTLGLTMSKGETTQIKLNTNDELLKKAFDKAESGINFFLGTGGTNYVSPDDGNANVNVAKIGEGNTKIDFGELVLVGASENYWLVNHLVNGDIGTTYFSGPNIDVCGTNYSDSVQISLFYKSGGQVNVRRQLINNLNSCAVITMTGSPILMTITPVNTSGKFYIEAKNGGSFSSQGVDVESQGSVGGTNKKLSIRQRYVLPGFLTAGIMSEGAVLSD